MLVIRDLMLGRTRFKEFSESPEGIPTNILTERLERLLHHGIIEKVPVTPGGKRFGYELTEKGESLRSILVAMKKWGLKWEKGTYVGLEPS